MFIRGGGLRSIFLYFSHQPRLLLLFGDGKEGVTPIEIEKKSTFFEMTM